MTDKNLALATITVPGATASRTFGARLGDIFNVKDYGAIADGGSHPLSNYYGSLGAAQAVYPFADSLTNQIDWAAFQLAINTMWASTFKGGTVYAPPGAYNSGSKEIDIGNHEIGSNNSVGRIVGSAKDSTFIFGNIPNGFVFYQNDGVNGPEEISNLTLANPSTWIGSGALRISNSMLRCNLVHFVGMINVLVPYNFYNGSFNNCTGQANSDATTGYNGTLGIAGYTPSVREWRSTSPYMAAIQTWGSNSSSIDTCGIENCVVAILLGVITGWASHCTVSGDILTVGGTLGTDQSTQFTRGRVLFGRGLDLPAWGSDPNDTTGGVTIVDDNGSDPALTGVGYAGTYRISSSFTISTPVPIWSRNESVISGISVKAIQTEACYHIVYVENAAAFSIEAAGGGSTPVEAVNQFGVTGLTPRCGIYLRKGGAGSFKACTPSNTPYYGAFVIDPDAIVTNITFDSCIGAKVADNAVTASVSGTVLTVTAFTSGSSIGVGMSVTGAGVTAGTIVTGNHTTDPTLTGTNTTGTYRVNNSQTVGSESMVVHTGKDWVMPTSTSAKAGLRFLNCGGTLPSGISSGLNDLGMTFTCLPGQAGASNNMHLITGQSFFIEDVAKSGGGTASPGDIVQAGGSQKVPVIWDNANWRYGGAGQFT